jgi:outer membrane protein assembly factor BamB
VVLLASIALCLAAAWPADRWTEFRGPSGTGHSDATGLPREWSETKNVVWKTRIHGRGWSSPVVLGREVWLTTATLDGHDLSVLKLDRETGKVLLDLPLFHVEKPADTRQYNSFASPTPVIEEGRVYVHFGSYGTAALDTATGKVLWERRDLPCDHWRGPGSSPMLHEDLLIVHFDGYDLQYAVALDRKTGRTVWKADRTHDFGTDDGDISPAANAVGSLDPRTGWELWRVRYPKPAAAARTLFAQGLL